MFSEDGLSQGDVVKLVEHFPDQAVDFYGALRSRLYDEQIEHLIDSVGVERIGSQVVNTKKPPEFRKPNFSLPHLIEQGEFIVREQQRLQEMRLVHEYNQMLRSPQPRETDHPAVFSQRSALGSEPSQPQESRSNSNGNGASSLPAPSVSSTPASSNGAGTKLPADVAQQVQQLVAQGYRIGVEYVEPRRFSTGSWKSCSSIQTGNIGEVMGHLEACLSGNQGNYVRVFGVDPNKRRVMETIVQRP